MASAHWAEAKTTAFTRNSKSFVSANVAHRNFRIHWVAWVVVGVVVVGVGATAGVGVMGGVVVVAGSVAAAVAAAGA